MQSFLYNPWSVIMTLTVLFTLFPYNTWGHLGSALRTGSGTLTKFALGDNVIFCTFNNLGDGKPPILSHVRVSREPQLHRRTLIKNDDLEGSRDPLLHTSNIKSPSYQHKILQFHSNGLTSSDNGYDYVPFKVSTNEYPIYPVASKFGKVDIRRLGGSSSTGSWTPSEDDDNDDGDSWERYTSINWKPNLLPKSEEPAYSPFIGPRALTNIPQFFQHLRENIHAIYEQQRESARNKVENEGKALSSLLPPEADGTGEEDIDKSAETKNIKIATPTRRGSSSNSESDTAQDNGVDVDMTRESRDSRGSDLYTLGSQLSGNEVEPDEKTKELLHFLGHGRQKYPKANNYNPAWLFTNLGLGKRSNSNGDSFCNHRYCLEKGNK